MDWDPSAAMQIGMRVVRGVDWKWVNQDNGEGSVGTVVEIGRQGSPTTPDKTVVVQWDHGTRTNYRTGFQGAYDLLLYDNAQIGVRHPNIICDCCKKHGIRGMRWKCKVCFDYDLCTHCYMNNKHDLSHAFDRYETAHSQPILLSPRQGLPRVVLKGIFQGARVVRGPDWEWGNQDGGEAKVGRVVDIRGWDVETGRSVASVTWTDGTTNVYRVGHKGKVDLKCISDASGGYYYKDHLPKLVHGLSIVGKPAEVQRKESSERHPFQHGDKVKCLLDIEILREMQEGHGGWNPKMAEFIGQTGTVHRITERGDVRVQYNSETRWTFHPGALTKHDSFWVGDAVRVMDCMETVKKHQVGHGEWTDDMAPALGQIGKVIKVFGDGDMRVSVVGQSWTFNPSCLTAYPREEDANLMTTENAKEPKSTLVSIFEKLLAQKTDCESPSSLVIEAAHGNSARVKEMLQKHPDKVDIRNQGKTALQVASHLGYIEVVKILLQANANIDLKDDEGDTALHYAAYGNQAAVIRVLLAKGANTELLNNAKFTALYIAVNKGFTEVVQVLCVPNSTINIQDSHGDTPLHCAINFDYRSIVEILTEVPNIDFTVQNNQGFNLLHHSTLKGNVPAVRKILERARQLVDSKKDDGFTALHLATLNNHQEVAEILIKEGHCDVNLRNNRNQSPLHLAVTQGHVNLAHLLLSDGADANAEDEDGDTPMHVAFMRQHLDLVESQEDDDGSSPLSKLQASGLMGNIETNVTTVIACMLAQAGADINYANHRGKSPMDLMKDARIAHLIKSFAQKYREEQAESESSTVTCSVRRVHTTPNTMTNLSPSCPANPAECLVCSEMAVLVSFFPCQHSIVCEECSKRMKKCIKCQVSITKKLRQDSTEVDGVLSLEASDQRKTLEDLESRYRQMEERMTCPICIDNHIKLVFQCGHGSCTDCSISLATCPICRQVIKGRIQIFV